MGTRKLLVLLVTSGLLLSPFARGKAVDGNPSDPGPSVTVNEGRRLQLSINKYVEGGDLPDPELREKGLREVTQILLELKRRKVPLNFDPLKLSPKDLAAKLDSLARGKPTAGLNSQFKRVIHVCVISLSFLCGYDYVEPPKSNITGYDVLEYELENPMNRGAVAR